MSGGGGEVGVEAVVEVVYGLVAHSKLDGEKEEGKETFPAPSPLHFYLSIGFFFFRASGALRMGTREKKIRLPGPHVLRP